MLYAAWSAMAVWVGGCTVAAPAKEPQALLELRTDLARIGEEVAGVHAVLADIGAAQTALAETVGNQSEQVAAIDASIRSLGASIDDARAEPTAVPAADTSRTRTVVVQGDKLVVGELERLWIDPPGAIITARIDTGASSSSLHAENLVEFERDGDDWVRFVINTDDGAEGVLIERRIVRHVRVFQQADSKGTRRPVVKMRVSLGNIQGPFDFTLADRSHLANRALLGRSFLTDVAVVDIGRRFVQTPFDPTLRAEQN